MLCLCDSVQNRLLGRLKMKVLAADADKNMRFHKREAKDRKDHVLGEGRVFINVRTKSSVFCSVRPPIENARPLGGGLEEYAAGPGDAASMRCSWRPESEKECDAREASTL